MIINYHCSKKLYITTFAFVQENTDFMKKCVLLMSGGIDSAVTVHLLKDNNYEIYPLFIDYKQQALERELKSIRYFCDFFNLNRLKILETDSCKDLFPDIIRNGNLSDLEISKSLLVNYMPFRNLIFSILGIYYCYEIEAEALSFGFTKKDSYSALPDTSPEFVILLNKLLNTILKGKKNIQVINPAFDYYKYDLIKIATKANIPLQHTYSCYFDKKCDLCKSCLDAVAAYNKASQINNF